MFLSRIVTRDETWCPHFESESKLQSQQWKYLNSPSPKKSKAVHTSTGKVMMTFLFNCRGPLLVDFLEHGTTINVKHYADTLQKLQCAIMSKCPGMMLDGIILLHVNTHPHTANLVRDKLQRFGWETNILLTAQISPIATSTFLET